MNQIVNTARPFDRLREALKCAFQERDAIVDALLAAFLAGEHVVMLGPPGTGKSALARALCDAFSDAKYFEWLLTRYTEPNELFGGIDLPKWANAGVYERRSEGMLPDASIAFLDEIFKANSSVLNALLSICNERVFHDGGKVHKTALRTIVAASNELPESAELEALYDRFLVRVSVDYVKDVLAFAAIVTGSDITTGVTLTLADLDAARAAVDAMPLGDGVVDALFALRAQLQTEGIVASDRRWKKLVALLRAHAYLCGDPQVEALHFEVLRHGLWRDPREVSKVNDVVMKFASPELGAAIGVFDAAVELIDGLGRERMKTDGPSVASEAKKALKLLQAGAKTSTPAVANRINALVEVLKGKHAQLVANIQKELDL